MSENKVTNYKIQLQEKYSERFNALAKETHRTRHALMITILENEVKKYPENIFDFNKSLTIKTKIYSLTIPATLISKLKRIAKIHRRSVAKQIAIIVEKNLNNLNMEVSNGKDSGISKEI